MTDLNRAYSIGDLSRLTSVHTETIRFYERKGLMPVPGRTAGGNRQYDQQMVKRLSFIKGCRALDFSLKEIEGFLRLKENSDDSCEQVYGVTQHHIEQIKEKIKNLNQLLVALEGMSSCCVSGKQSRCTALDDFHAPIKNI